MSNIKYPKKGWNRKEGWENKDFKKGASWVKGWVLPSILHNKGNQKFQ